MTKYFPIQAEYGARPHPMQVPWDVAELAYSVYAGLYGKGGQSLERLAERGGFGPSEMDAFLPDWRERCDRIAALESAINRILAVNGYCECGSDQGHECGLCTIRQIATEAVAP